VRTVGIPGEHKSLTAEQAAAAARAAGIAAAPAASVAAALAAIVGRRREEGPARVLICGSLYLAGTVLADNG
jgi:dihydrofolate synthase/folylpolyglutamate synthase